MTAQTTNEAAERLRWRTQHEPAAMKMLDEALAAERRATVERIRARIVDRNGNARDEVTIHAILDEEAARG